MSDPQQIGPYTIIRKLGAGGMGAVYLAQHRHLARRAAVKVLLPEISSNAEVVSRFFTEARATSRLHHPSIVEVFDCDVMPSGQAYIVMEYLAGETLGSALQRNPGFRNDQKRLAAIIGQVAEALASAHATGIVHRDLKPDNVFLGAGHYYPASVEVKILDFGIAKLVDDNTSKTRTGSLLGTPIYMSPEQCRGAGRVDHRTDIYSLGCMAFEMFCGEPPFVREGAGELLVAHLQEIPRRMRAVRPDVPQVLDDLVAQMLLKDPAARPQSFGEVVAVVEGFLGVPAARFSELVVPPMGFPDEDREPAYPTPAPRVPTGAPVTGRPVTGGPVTGGPVTGGPVTGAPRRPTPPPVGLMGGTSVLPVHTTLTSSASSVDSRADEIVPAGSGRWKMIVPLVGAAVVAAAVFAFRSSGSKTDGNSAGKTEGAAAVAVAPASPGPSTPPPPPVAPPPPDPAPSVPATVSIEMSSRPSGADVWVVGDRQKRGATPIRLELPRGSKPVVVTLKASGFADKLVEVDAARDGTLQVELLKADQRSSSDDSRDREKIREKTRDHSHARVDEPKTTKKTGGDARPTKPITSPAASDPYHPVGD